MYDFETSLVIRTVLLFQLLTILLVPDYAFQVHQKLLKIARLLNTPVLTKKPSDKKKKQKFWEIDMTKFEP
jgi:hypothetical protein